jgi:hypothetical protein
LKLIDDPKSKGSKRKNVGRLHLIKLKNFCAHTKRYFQESEKTIHRWEKILKNHISGKDLIPRIYKEPEDNPTEDGQAH